MRRDGGPLALRPAARDNVRMRIRAVVAVVALAGLFAAAQGGAQPARFSAIVTNPWFPLRPGTVYVYRGVKDGKAARDVVTVMHTVKTIQGAPCVVVRDRLYLGGKLE